MIGVLLELITTHYNPLLFFMNAEMVSRDTKGGIICLKKSLLQVQVKNRFCNRKTLGPDGFTVLDYNAGNSLKKQLNCQQRML